jgi:arylsulfatase A-like enzyme
MMTMKKKASIFSWYFLARYCSLLIFLWSCAGNPSSEEAVLPPPNVVWINVEDINPALGCYGDTLAVTPHLDQLAREGIVYRHAYATAPICAPSRSSFITGVYSTSAGTQHLRSVINRPEVLKTMPEYLKGMGYFTTNYGKTDWNFSPQGVFDLWEQDLAPWRKRPDTSKPFYSMFVIGGTHEGAANRLERYQEVMQQSGDEPQLREKRPVPVPPYHPQTPEFQLLWNNYYNLITSMDKVIGEIMANLEADGLKENTVVFFFSDHGFGVPRHKRYLNKSGVHVPLLVYVPGQYQHLVKEKPGTATDQLVSLVDLVPSVLNMLDIEQPAHVQGQAFLGRKPAPPREWIYVERSRADDLFEMSRGILNQQYMYVRHYMPHLPYIRSGVIQGDAADKISYNSLATLHRAGELPAGVEKYFHAKPVEELFDLAEDPFETKNMANDFSLNPVKQKMAAALSAWSLQTHDLGFLPEAEYMIRSEGTTPFELARNPGAFPLEAIMAAASLVGTGQESKIVEALKSTEGGVQYWGVIAAQNLPVKSPAMIEALISTLENTTPSVQIAAAEVLCQLGGSPKGLSVLMKWVNDDRPAVALQAARSLVEIGTQVKPVAAELKDVQGKYLSPPGGQRKYKDFEYSSFIGWALEKAMQNGGVMPL